MSLNTSDLREGRINDQLERELNAHPEVTENLEEGKRSFQEWSGKISDYVNKNPWASAAGGFVAGMALGLCLRRG